METILLFTSSHEWVRNNGDGTITTGISDQAQELLGDVVFVDLPEIGDTAVAGEVFALIESVKAASDVYSPLSGEIVATNETLQDNPELINESPLENGWIAKIKLSDIEELSTLMDEETYLATF